MPRTVESIVENHRAARALRAVGKPIWSKTIDIKSIVKDAKADKSLPVLASVAVRVAAALRAGVDPAVLDITSDQYDRNLDEAVEELEDWTADGLAERQAQGDNPREEFDGRLEDIYDWADGARVWMG